MTTKNKSKRTQQRDDFFVKRFGSLLKEWHDQDKSKNTQGEMARQINNILSSKGKEETVKAYYISDWKKGRWFPDKYLSEIAEVLGVEEKDFFFQTHDEEYKLSSEYMTQVGRGEIKPFCDEIGLDLQFLDTARKLLGTYFEKLFPTWTPLSPNPDILSDQSYIRLNRNVWSKSAEMDEDVRVLQYEIEVEEDGKSETKLITFTREDLRFLKDVQTEVVDYIQFLLMKRENELQREADEATRRSRQKLKNGGIGFRPLQIEELNQIDKYHDYHYQYGKQKDGVK